MKPVTFIIFPASPKVNVATTIRQVATAAGVSVATVSRALSGSTAVVPETRNRVLRVAAGLEYSPSRLGRSLATGSTGNIGVILPDVTNPFYTTFLAELEARLGATDRGILLGDSHEDAERERATIRRMVGQVDALILASSRMPDEDVVDTAGRLPVVLVNRMLNPGVMCPEPLTQISLDVRPGFSQAVEHLHALGHRCILYLDGPRRSWSGREKRRILRSRCAELDVDLTILATDAPDFSGGRRALATVDARTTAIIAFNDQMALGVLSALRDEGLSVPRDVSVIGCDDSLPDGLAWPALTTVDSSPRTLGVRTAEAILDPLHHHAAQVATRLVVRATTAEASSRSPVTKGTE